MKVLGICHDVLICSAAIVVDGEIVFATPEERLDRVKQSRGFPSRAIAKCLNASGLKWEDLDAVAIAWNPAIELETPFPGYIGGRRWRGEHLYEVPAQLMRIANCKSAEYFEHSWGKGPRIIYIDHYRAHIGNAASLSPSKTCALAVVDGRGERQTALLGSITGTDIKVFTEVNFPHSLGLFYGAVTQYLGFKPDSDEWKVMALASYANENNKYKDVMKNIIHQDQNGGFKLNLDFFEFYNFWDSRMYSNLFIDTFGPPRGKDDPIEDRHQEIAAAMQLAFEETMANLLTALHKQADTSEVALSGGCFMNSVFNGKIEALSPFKKSYISSCPDDSGTAVGAALYVEMMQTGRRSTISSSQNFWGEMFSDANCLEVATRFKLPNLEILKNPSERAAEDISNGKIIGWMQGRAEFGQRALGNRSILADPRRPEMKDLINAAIKYREYFRPFAPSILAEKIDDYFECNAVKEVPFMERVLPFKPGMGERVPSVMHIDGTGRVQTVNKDGSPRYRKLIEAFDKLTGTPIVLNTSFNLNGQPIVNSPEDAIQTFYSCGLDVLYLGNVRISK